VWIAVATMTWHVGSQGWAAIQGLSFVLSCAASSFAMLAALALSWCTTALLRRAPAIARVI
jgi:hypothetical protein